MNKIHYTSLLFVFSGFSVSAAGADTGTLAEVCDSCHGADGVSQWNDMPTIAGIDEFVHSEALYIYRDRARPCADSEYRQGDTGRTATNMCEITQDLEDQVIEDLAAHYAALPFVPAAQAFDANLALAGKAIHESECGMCHSAGGSDPAAESSILAGQWMGYLESSFADYRAGERDQPPRMQQAIDGLSDDDVQALLNYYASQQ